MKMHTLYPGKNEHKGAAKQAVNMFLQILFLSSLILLIFLIFCLGIITLDFKLTIIPEIPNNPVSKGSRGSLTGKSKVKSPKNPAIRKTTKEIKNSSSLKIRYEETKIKTNGIMIPK